MIRNIIFDWSGTLVDDLPAVWQATNYVLAQSERADVYAGATMEKATRLLQEAQRIPDPKVNSERIVGLARQAAQTAEDARTIAAREHQ